jgi:hypothetical protein
MALDTSPHALYEYQPSFILGFHGCDKETGERILDGEEPHLKPSEKDHDWLGHGIYFWEGNVSRAWEWARDGQTTGKIKTPFVLGAIIDLRHCLDLFDREAIRQVLLAYDTTKTAFEQNGKPLPSNVGATPDKAGRKLDCTVMNTLHGIRAESHQPAYDSIRGPFLEGEPIYEGAGFRSHTHIQICVRELACVKGYFRPLASVL